MTEKKEHQEIVIETEKESLAVVINTPEGEKIFLPPAQGSNSTYYLEQPETLTRYKRGFKLVTEREIQSYKVLS